MKELLIKLNACEEAREWAADKSWKEIYDTCYRGDWLLWLFRRTNPFDKRLLTLAKGHCANTIRHLMKDKRSIAAVDAAIAFGNGQIDENQLSAAYSAAYADAYSDAYSAAAAAAATASATAAYAYADAYKKSQQETADICRMYLPFEVWNINNTTTPALEPGK